MALSISEVDVERIADETDLDVDDINAAFGVFTPNDQVILAALDRTKTFEEVRRLILSTDPDTFFVRYRLHSVLVDMAVTAEDAMDALELVERGPLEDRARAKLLSLTDDTDALVEIAETATDPDTMHHAILKLAAKFTK